MSNFTTSITASSHMKLNLVIIFQKLFNAYIYIYLYIYIYNIYIDIYKYIIYIYKYINIYYKYKLNLIHISS